MIQGEQEAAVPAAETRRRHFQFSLKSLLALPALAALCAYMYDWRMHRPPYQENGESRLVFDDFVADLHAGRLKDAYESTSVYFQTRMTRRQFDALIRRYPTLRKGWIADRGSRAPRQEGLSLKRQSLHCITLSAKRQPMVELWVWIATDDSFLRHRPPPPRVEEVQIRRTDPANPPFCPPLIPSWE